MLSNRFINSEKGILVDNEKVITNDTEIVEFLNYFFFKHN